MNDVKSSVAMGLHTLTSVPGAGLHRYSPPCSGPSYPSVAGPPSRGAPGPPPNHPPPRMTVTTSSAGNLFGGLDDSLLARAEALAAADLGGKAGSSPGGPAGGKPGMADLYGHDMGGNQGHRGGGGQLGGSLYHGHGGESMLDQLNGGGGGHVSMPLTGITPADHTVTSHSSHMAAAAAAAQMYTPVYSTHPMSSVTNSYQQPQHQHPGMHGASGPHVPGLQSPMGGGPGGVQGGGPLGVMVHHPGGPGGPGGPHELDCDPRELEAFAEHFKQRRIKLGVTQADVGNALGKLKIPGVGSLSQSTICRFESLTLSHNNMIALKPVLQAWLEEAEKAAREASQKADGVFNGADKKRKRTSIAAPEKRSLEAYFAIQPRPSGEKIAQIAEKLDLKKNVVRVWFCNQRQKQKRMKFSASSMQGPHTPHPGH